MGSVISTILFTPIYNSSPFLLEHKKFFDSLKLMEQDIGRLFRLFRKIDYSGKTTVSVVEILVYCDLDSTPFTEKVFSMFDIDGNGTIDFKEFIIIVWNYCTLDKNNLVYFVFDLYDKDGSQEIDVSELSVMLKDVYGTKFLSNQNAVQTLNTIQQLYQNTKGSIKSNKFAEFSRTHGALLYPAFQLQRSLRMKILGRSFWNNIKTKRLEIVGETHISRKDLMYMMLLEEVIFESGKVCRHDQVEDRSTTRKTVRRDTYSARKSISISSRNMQTSIQRLAEKQFQSEGRRGSSVSSVRSRRDVTASRREGRSSVNMSENRDYDSDSVNKSRHDSRKSIRWTGNPSAQIVDSSSSSQAGRKSSSISQTGQYVGGAVTPVSRGDLRSQAIRNSVSKIESNSTSEAVSNTASTSSKHMNTTGSTSDTNSNNNVGSFTPIRKQTLTAIEHCSDELEEKSENLDAESNISNKGSLSGRKRSSKGIPGESYLSQGDGRSRKNSSNVTTTSSNNNGNGSLSLRKKSLATALTGISGQSDESSRRHSAIDSQKYQPEPSKAGFTSPGIHQRKSFIYMLANNSPMIGDTGSDSSGRKAYINTSASNFADIQKINDGRASSENHRKMSLSITNSVTEKSNNNSVDVSLGESLTPHIRAGSISQAMAQSGASPTKRNPVSGTTVNKTYY